ncbi:MAG TPA: NAD(P)-binding protein [Myxococcota bacterium]|nr:NAD(P)-binding protein [Myxococcota bacterium]
MPIYHFREPRLGRVQVREWRRRAWHALGMLLLVLLGCTVGLAILDRSVDPLTQKVFVALWNAANLITTLGDFSHLDDGQRRFMLLAMFSALIVAGLAISRLSGILSAEAVMAYRENRSMERTLDHLAHHVVVIGFGPLGRLVAERLRAAGEHVLIVDRDSDHASLASELGYLVLLGDAGIDDGVLQRARVATAKALVVTTVEPDRKLAITLIAHTVNPQLQIAVTGDNSQRGQLLHHAGASDVVVADDLIAGTLVGRLGKTSG